MKRVLIAIAAVLLAVFGLMAARAFSVAQPPALAAEATPSPIDANLAAQHLAQAIRFQTVSYGDGIKEDEKTMALRAMYEWMERTYPYFLTAAGPEVIGESLLFTWHGKNPNLLPVMLMAHMDVVPVVPGTEKDWMHEPFAGDIADGFVWGRGAIDDKGQMVAILEAAEHLAASGFQPERTIMLALGQDEEVGGGQGNAMIAKTLTGRGTHFAWVLDEGSSIMNEPYPGVRKPVAFVGTAEKGYLSLELTAHGQGGHSARPSNNLALERISNAIVNVVHHPFESDLDDVQRAKLDVLTPMVPFADKLILANLWLTKPLVMRRLEAAPETAAVLHTTISPTMLNAGIKENVIPPSARAVINFRLHQRDTIKSVTDHVRAAIGDPQVDVTQREETLSEATKIVGVNDPVYVYLAGMIKASYGVPVAPEMMTGATDSRHYIPLADAVLRFRPFRTEPSDLPRVHGTNERVAVADLGDAAGFYMRLIQDLK
jgi:carboxypeptidase PM20D1